MARKSTKPASRSARSRPAPLRRPAAKSRPTVSHYAPARHSAARPSPLARASALIKRIRLPRLPARRAGAGASAPARRQRSTSRPSPSVSRPASRPAPVEPASARRPGLSIDARLDISGVVMIFIGFSTLLSLLSINHDTSTGGWLAFLDETFGWGAYLFPLALIAVGLWLILRNFERVPHISLERLFGIGLLYGNLLAVFHYLGQGGGLLGRGLFSALQFALGVGGAVIALLAWLVIALTLTLDVSVADLFRWVPPLVMRLQDVWDDFRTRNGEAIPKRPSTQGGQPAKGSSLTGPPGAAVPSGVATAAGLHPFTPVPVGQPRAWVLPSLDEILEPGLDVTYDDEIDRQRARIIEETLASFGAPVNVIEINRGPTITQFGVEPDFIETRTGRMRVRVGKIATLADDLALALSARTIRVQAPVPGKGYVGIEVPNEQIAMVALRDVLESEALTRLKSPLRFALGQDVAGNAVAAGLDSMPHLLIAGATGSGKSVCVNALITCLLLNNTPDDLRLIMVDPKRVELTGYNGIPHLLSPVVVEMERVVGALQWVLREMDARYHKLAELGTRNINEYNARLESRGGKKLPRLVVFIDELADLMMLAPDETERSLTRLAQLARATGIHLVIATQRPSVDVVTGVIKANFPARVAFAVASGTDSRVILDQPGAERLLGRGDMLFQAPDAPAPIRIQGAFVSDVEIQRLVQYWQSFAGAQPVAPASVGGVVDALPPGIPLKQMSFFEEAAADSGDPLLNEAIDLARRQGRASITMLQRRLRIGYTRAARLIETMQERKIVSANSGPQGFEILDYGPAASPVEEQRG